MKESIPQRLSSLLSLNSESSNIDQNLKTLKFIQETIGGQIISQSTTTAPILVHTPQTPHLLWIGHTDIIPKHKFQEIKEEGDKIFDRGSFDMKGSVASFISVLEAKPNLKNKVGFIITSDEEVGGFDGAKWLFETNKLNFSHMLGVIVGEPTNLEIGVNSKGILVLGLKISGKSAHASQPWLGVSASEAIIDISHRIKNEVFNQPTSQEDWKTSFNFGLLQSGGENTNIIPDQAELRIDIRFIKSDPPEKLISKIKKILLNKRERGEINSFVTENRMQNNSETASPSHPLVKKLQTSVETVLGESKLVNTFGTTDARHLSTICPNIPIIRFGPIGGGAHSSKEWVSKKSLVQQSQILSNFFSKP